MYLQGVFAAAEKADTNMYFFCLYIDCVYQMANENEDLWD